MSIPSGRSSFAFPLTLFCHRILPSLRLAQTRIRSRPSPPRPVKQVTKTLSPEITGELAPAPGRLVFQTNPSCAESDHFVGSPFSSLNAFPLGPRKRDQSAA